MCPTVLTLLVVLLSVIALLATPASAADYTVIIGWETLTDVQGPSWYSIFFYPQQLTVVYGDSVTWVWASGEIHNVVFSGNQTLSEANPDGTFTAIAGTTGNQTHFVDPEAVYSSGIRNKFAAPTTLTFVPAAGFGTFPYYCSIHGSVGMVAELTVLPAGSVAPQTPEQVNATVSELIAGLEAFADQEIANFEAIAPATGAEVQHVHLADGTNEWIVYGGAMWMNGNDSMYARFLPTYLEVNLGDTVTWKVNGSDPHLVYFQIDNIWPLIYANWSHNQTEPVSPLYQRQSPAYNLSPSFDPTTGAPITSFPTAIWPNAAGVIDSGIIVDSMEGAIFPFPTSYSVKFVEVGSWPYQCAIHLDVGMIAQVVVKAAGEPLCTDATNTATCAAVTIAPVSVLGDPQFVGLLGQSYQVHGIDGAVYSLISERAAQVNARFAFLTGPRLCVSGSMVAWKEGSSSEQQASSAAISCWSHDGSYLAELALFTPTVRLYVQAGSAATGFAAVQYNTTDATTDSTSLTFQQLSSHHLTVTLGSYTLLVDNSDGFVDLARVQPLVPMSRLSSHGLLGQTHTRPQGARKQTGLAGVIDGSVDDYVVEGGLWAADDMWSRYKAASQ